MMVLATAFVMLTVVRGMRESCDASDANLVFLNETLCWSLGGGCTGNITAQGDWPSQAVYYNNLLVAIADSKGHCLDTKVARTQIDWLNVVSNATPWWNTWFVFQPQYYDMPRVPGSRIESPATLGRKCWAFAYLAEIWANVKAPLLGSVAASGSGQDLNSMVGAYESAVAMSMPLCDRVMANCFVNASYNPAARNGTCHDAVRQFYVGYQWEDKGGGRTPNGPRESIPYPFPTYSQNDLFDEYTQFAVDTALNFIV